MSGRGIGDLGPIGLWDLFRSGVTREDSGFETLEASLREDRLRARGLRKSAARFPELINGEEAEGLAAQLQLSGDGFACPHTLASSVYMRSLRGNIGGHLWRLVDRVGVDRVHSFTVIPKSWEFTAQQLADVDPRLLLRALLGAMYTRGAGQANGWVIAFIHGEWDPAGVFRLHVHGFASGGMVGVIDRLRELPNYETLRILSNGKLNPVYRRVRISWKPLKNLPSPITYRLQAYWPSRALFISDNGARVRARRKHRIAEPQHSQVLLWMDRWQIADLTLMVGLRVTKTGLVQTKPVK